MTRTPKDSTTRTTVIAVHVVAALFWAVIAMVGGEMSLVLTAVFGVGALLVAAGVVLLLVRHRRARSVLVAGDLVPTITGAFVVVYLVQDTLRNGGFADLVIDSGAALALYAPMTLGPLLLALRLPAGSPPSRS